MNLSTRKLSIAGLATAIVLALPGAPATAAPRASFTWSTPDAYKAQGVGAIGDQRWLLELDACGSQPDGHPLRSFRWTVTGGDDDITTRTTTSCRLERAPQPPPIPATCLRPGAQDDPGCDPATSEVADPRVFLAEGTYRVGLQITDAAGGTDATSRSVTIDNRLVVALGDSFTSGEGNPDVRGEWGIDGFSGVRWANAQCHRSHRPAVALVADELERSDARTSVTFLNFACSGAEIDAGLLGPYDGIEGGDDLPAQVDQLRAALCRNKPAPCTRSRMETIDHLVLTIGINDVSFSDILMTCMAFGDHCRPVAGPTFDAGYRGLEQGYRRLAAALGRFPIRRISIVDYPTDPFEKRTVRIAGATVLVGGGCDGAMRGISAAEGEWFAQLGVRLRVRMRSAAARYGWGFVTGTTEAFRGHGYCSDDPWYRTAHESFLRQGDRNGTMHPDASGHAATARLLLAAVRAPGPTPTPPRQPGVPGSAQDPGRVVASR